MEYKNINPFIKHVSKYEIVTLINSKLVGGVDISVAPSHLGVVEIVIGAKYGKSDSCTFTKSTLEKLIDNLIGIKDAMEQ